MKDNKIEQLKELLEEKESLLASDEACRRRGIKEYSKECHEIRKQIKLLTNKID